MDLCSQQWIAGSVRLLFRIHNSICQEVEDLQQYISGVRWSTTVSVRSWRSYKYICRCNKQKTKRLFNMYLICTAMSSPRYLSRISILVMSFLLWFTWCDNEDRVVWLNCLFWWGRIYLRLEIFREGFLIYLKDVHSATTMLDFHTFDWYYFIGVFIYKFFILNSLNIFEFRLL